MPRVKPVFIIFNLFFFSFLSYSQQNLVYNGDFEEYSSCPDNVSVPSEIPYQIEKCTGWSAPTYGTSDYFNVCAIDYYTSGQMTQPPFSAICETCFGCQPPYNGNGYLGFGAASYTGGSGSDGYNGIMWWEYINGKTIEPLVAGEKYLFSMEISLSEVSDLMINEIGVLLTDYSIHTANTASLNFIPQIIFHDENYFNDTVNWIHLEQEFIAEGGETYITIGNFKDNINTDTLRRLPINTGGMSNYIFVDEVKLIKVYDDSSILIPNVFTPNNDGVNDTIDFNNLFINKVSILNRWGNEVFLSSENNKMWNGKDKLGNELPDGVYYYFIEFENETKTGFIHLVR